MAQPTGSRSAAEGAAQAAEGASRAADGAAQAAAAADAELVVYEVQTMQRPIVYEVRKRKKGKGKKKYSRGLKTPQLFEEGVTRSAERLAQALADGISEYRRRRNNSARKKQDGALKDVLRNVSRGAEEAMTTAAKAPTDFTRKVSTKRLTRLVVPPMPRLMR